MWKLAKISMGEFCTMCNLTIFHRMGEFCTLCNLAIFQKAGEFCTRRNLSVENFVLGVVLPGRVMCQESFLTGENCTWRVFFKFWESKISG